ncbi:PREDICTED: auxin-responsive protein IAA28-like [Nelumbo nucifera]|uniref:Auxin-responsive protein n=2 Tax=Nelumbo nucifera TaxID=4432 RepID=A0A1U7YRE0_NELNU|nr:PREDICTED: auxin-responsive protein IAA28-like [Nelumbo nucifera]DAD27211.1 TPA_asm: hypothetical protein HUJ06_028679 [Nelumbo nucifera]
MELQLGLALSYNPINEFGFKKYDYQPKEVLGSELWSHSSCSSSPRNKSNKRSFDEAFEKLKPVIRTLPLFSWNDKPNDDDDDPNGLDKSSSTCSLNKSEEEEDCVVGWPPINSWRKKLHCQPQDGEVESDQIRRDENSSRGPKSKYVKMKMEGVAIGRKVDLSLHSSYGTLTNTLLSMFGKCQRSLPESKAGTGHERYTLVYQDREGDWLLVGDVPWESFIVSVQRLKLLKNGG